MGVLKPDFKPRLVGEPSLKLLVSNRIILRHLQFYTIPFL